MGGFLNDLNVDWDKVSSNPNTVSDGTHHAFVFDAKVVDLTAKDKGKSLVITYKNAPDDSEPGKQKDEWRGLPVVTADGKFASDKDANNASWLKQRLLSLGVPESKIGDLDPGDLVGTEVYVTYKTKGEWQNVVNVKLASDSENGDATAAAGNNASTLSDLL
jgi:hypothetical protein